MPKTSFILVCLVFLAGCNSTKNTTAPAAQTTDPLFGGGQPIKPASYTPKAGVQPPVTSSNGANPSTTMSTAELATGVHQPFDASHDLRMGTPTALNRNQPPTDGWHAQGGPDAPSIALNRPEPINDNTDSRPAAPAPAVIMPNNVAMQPGVDSLIAQLKSRGLVWLKIEMTADANDWDLACAIPNRQNRDVQRTYEVRAKDPVAGLQAILDRMDRDR